MPATLAEAMEYAIIEESGDKVGRILFGNFQSSSSSSHSHSTSAPMDLNAIAHEEEKFYDESYEPSSSATPNASQQQLLEKLAALELQLSAIQKSRPSNRSDRVAGRSREEIERFLKEGRCFFCGEKDHMKKDCPKRKNASDGNNQQKKSN